jgi:hypothetical protein
MRNHAGRRHRQARATKPHLESVFPAAPPARKKIRPAWRNRLKSLDPDKRIQGNPSLFLDLFCSGFARFG